jgi:hypothetical protein
MVRAALPLLVLGACGGGVNDETLLVGLTVVAAVLPEGPPAPDVPFEVQLTVSDPDGGALVGAWTCGESSCSRAAGPLSGEDTVAFELTASQSGVLWTAACVAGACDPGDLGESVLRDPIAWMADQPFDDAFLASVALPVLESTATPVPWNPVIEEAPEADALLDATPGEARTLSFTVPGATTARGRATAGGFSMASVDVASDGTVELEWLAPKPAGDARVYVVFDVEGAGTAVWSADAQSVAP